MHAAEVARIAGAGVGQLTEDDARTLVARCRFMTADESAVWSMSNEELLAAARDLVRRSQDVEARLLVHLGEIDERKLYLDCSSPSMFAYCVGELGLSEDAAYNRILVARAGRRLPAILDAIRDGRVHLWGMRLLTPHLTEANHRLLIAQATGKSKREIEELVASLAPRAPVASMIRSIPERSALIGLPAAPGAAPFAVDALAGSGPATAEDLDAAQSALFVAQPSAPPPPRIGPAVVPLAAQTYKVQFTAGRAFREKLCEAQDLMRHRVPDGNLETIFEAALELLIEQVKKERFAVGRKPRGGGGSGGSGGSGGGGGANGAAEGGDVTSTGGAVASSMKSPDEGAPEPASRHVPDAIRRAVYERDGGRCTFVDERGRRCPATGALEVDHVEGFAETGRHDVDKLRLLCRAHNQREAEKRYGRAFMESARKARDTVPTRSGTSPPPPTPG
jgi:uncharacterized membrane protein YgcG